MSWRLLALLVLCAVGIAFASAFPPPPASAAARQCGVASWYGYTGHRTASGELFDGNAMTAASRTLKFGTVVRVVDVETGRAVTVRINDRGPYIGGRILDLSRAAADRLGLRRRGTARVCLTSL